MNQLTRFTVCMLINHKWVKTRYPPGSDGRPEVSSCAVAAAARRTTTKEVTTHASPEQPLPGAASSGSATDQVSLTASASHGRGPIIRTCPAFRVDRVDWRPRPRTEAGADMPMTG